VSSTFVSTWSERRINSLQDIHQLAVDIGALAQTRTATSFEVTAAPLRRRSHPLPASLQATRSIGTRYFGSSAEWRRRSPASIA
jgi:hypothetical protein